MDIQKLFGINSIFLEITSYLQFEDKIILSKSIRKNCLRKFNFNNKDFIYNNIYDVFTNYKGENNDENGEYMSNLSPCFVNELNQCYDDDYEYNIEHYMSNTYNSMITSKDRELTQLLHKTYMKVYARKIVEYIENNNLFILSYYDYDFFELERKENIDIYNSVMEYYKYVFENELMDIFCDRCGLFGHNNTSKKCVFYNESNHDKITNENITSTEKEK